MTKKKETRAVGTPTPATGAVPSPALDRFFQMEEHIREVLDVYLQKKGAAKEAKKIYEGAIQDLLIAIRKEKDPEFVFDKDTDKTAGDGEEGDD